MTQTSGTGPIPVWPFRDAAEAAGWRQGNPPADQAWHLDPAETALRFARDFLGYDEVTQVTSTTSTSTDASVGVGSVAEGSAAMTVAVVQLVRRGGGALDPWEVVGARGQELSISSPAAAAPVPGSPLTVGGSISGVDESLHVQVRAVGTAAPLGEILGIGAGGTGSPWSTPVDYVVPGSGAVLTVAVSTGGHLQRVERFTAVGVVQG